MSFKGWLNLLLMERNHPWLPLVLVVTASLVGNNRFATLL